MTASNALITQIYIGYFNRAPDPAGLNYWVENLASGMSIATIAESFSRQSEAISSYAYLANPLGGSVDAFLTSVYNNLFNHAPDAAGLSYWKGELAAGKPVGGVIIDIISGAQGSDKTVIDNKVAVAQSYVDQISDATGEIFRIGDARRVVADIDTSTISVTLAQQTLHNLGTGNGLTIKIVDSTGTLAPFDAGIRDSLAAAWDMWAVHFTRTAPIELEVTFQSGAPGVLASASSLIEVYTGEIFDGRRLTQTGVGVELVVGRDPNGTTPDGRITIATDPSRLVFRDSVADPMPRDKFDALSIFAHELGHVLGFRSNLDSSGRPIQPGFLTNYDQYVTGISASNLNFLGPNAVEAKGGAVGLSNSGPAHLGTGGDLMASSLGAGQTKVVGVLDIAVLQDLGLPVSLAAFDGVA